MKEEIFYDVRNEHIDLLTKAPDGTEDTRQYCDLENVSIGTTFYDCTENICLKNG